MSNFEHHATPTGRESRRPPKREVRTISISGFWWANNDELMERVDSAMHDAGLCACVDHEQFYAMSVVHETDGQPDNRA